MTPEEIYEIKYDDLQRLLQGPEEEEEEEEEVDPSYLAAGEGSDSTHKKHETDSESKLDPMHAEL